MHRKSRGPGSRCPPSVRTAPTWPGEARQVAAQVGIAPPNRSAMARG